MLISQTINKEVFEKVKRELIKWESEKNGYSDHCYFCLGLIILLGLLLISLMATETIKDKLSIGLGCCCSLPMPFAIMGLISRLEYRLKFNKKIKKAKDHYQTISQNLKTLIKLKNKLSPKQPLKLPTALFKVVSSYLDPKEPLALIDRKCYQEINRKEDLQYLIDLSTKPLREKLAKIRLEEARIEENNRRVFEYNAHVHEVYSPYHLQETSYLGYLHHYSDLSSEEREERDFCYKWLEIHNQYFPQVINGLLREGLYE